MHGHARDLIHRVLVPTLSALSLSHPHALSLTHTHMQGHARDLIHRALVPTLSAAGVRRLAVSVDEDDAPSTELWGSDGFEPLLPGEQRHLAWQLPNFQREAVQGTSYFALDLTKLPRAP
jgi:hypothetical protein